MKLLSISLLLLFTNTIETNLFRKLNQNLLALLGKRNDTDKKAKPGVTRYFLGNNKVDEEQFLSKTRRFEKDASSHSNLGISNEDIEKRTLKEPEYRRFVRADLNRNWVRSKSIGLTSSSADEKTWKTEYKFRWISRKKDALQDPIANQTRGHVVNMAAARPWRVPCGDIKQHDVATGSCTLPFECPPELRIYRGDGHCGTSSFVCCGAQVMEKDLYEAFDPTMTDTSRFSTSSEIRLQARGSRENKARKRQRKRNRTLKARYRRKRFIKKSIRKLAKEVRKELNRAFRNSTENRRHVIRNLKIMIKKMKNNFRDERHIAKFQQDLDLAHINFDLGEKLKKIRGLNYNFLTNDTFRAIIVNGTAGREGPQLFEAYPELNSDYIQIPELGETRRVGSRVSNKKPKKHSKKYKDYLEYDIEFGMFL